MSPRALKWVFWAVLVVTVPVRYQLADTEWAPTLRLVFLTTITFLLHLSEGYGGSLWALLLALGFAQCAIYLLLFYAIAAFAVRQLVRRVSPGIATALVLALTLALLVGATATRSYVTPISSHTMYSSLVDVLR